MVPRIERCHIRILLLLLYCFIGGYHRTNLFVFVGLYFLSCETLIQWRQMAALLELGFFLLSFHLHAQLVLAQDWGLRIQGSPLASLAARLFFYEYEFSIHIELCYNCITVTELENV